MLGRVHEGASSLSPQVQKIRNNKGEILTNHTTLYELN